MEFLVPTLDENENILIPDMKLVTEVPLPDSIDLTDQQFVVHFIEQLVNEEKNKNQYFAGMYIFGSMSRETATNNSDIDAIHVVHDVQKSDENRRPDGKPWALRYRLKTLFEICYGIKFNDSYFRITLSDSPDVIATQGTYLDKDSIPIGLSNNDISRIDRIIGYKNREKIENSRNHKNITPLNLQPHQLNYSKNQIFPWWSRYALLTEI